MQKSLLFTLLLLTILLFSCKPRGDGELDQNYTFLNPEISTHLRQSGYEVLNDAEVVDKEYVLPTIQWVQDVFAPEYRKLLFNWNWKFEGVIDCDDASALARIYAQRVYWQKNNKNFTLAFGWMDYYREDGEYHSINFFFVRDPNILDTMTLEMRHPAVKVIFWEPQTQEIITLTESEISSIIRYRI